ncbi:TSUP family transporter [Pelistega europaea]|uniref:Probable membrane transporter protein n=1 Tax=Pelistega europaea TaxID=106147 RepID=A0A7Y4P438_9BURK|nr:TSUP family transporter [Pelistega europaea]NOL49692.1 TSUP family transporter [Pelistega europaea]
MDFSFSWDMLLLFFAAATLAGFIDSIAGGGGLIGIPVLLLSGLPPVNALATNKIQGMAGSFTASMTMIRKGVVNFKKIWFAALMSFIGATLGTICVHFINVKVLDIIIPIVLILIGLYFLLVPSVGEIEKKPRMDEKLFNVTVVPSIGFYDGIFGPGTGSFFSLSNIALRGQQIVTATGNAKVFNFASNIAAVVVFLVSGKIVWLVGGVMIVGQILGAYIGSLMVIKNGAKLVRPLVVLMCFLMVAKYIYEKFVI